MKTKLLLIASLLVFSGCAKTLWVERCVPTTEAERKAITEHVEKILAATPRTLSGHDQDWDDAISEAHRQARQTVCPLTYWEYKANGFPEGGGEYTGRWRVAQATK